MRKNGLLVVAGVLVIVARQLDKLKPSEAAIASEFYRPDFKAWFYDGGVKYMYGVALFCCIGAIVEGVRAKRSRTVQASSSGHSAHALQDQANEPVQRTSTTPPSLT